MVKQKEIVYEFGVMSSRFILKSKSFRTAKLVMVVYLSSKEPIVIYLPKEKVIDPKQILTLETGLPVPNDFKEVFKTVKRLK